MIAHAQVIPVGETRPALFEFGDFARLRRQPDLWGIIVGPSDYPGRWMFEYTGGARVTNSAEALELFEPTLQQRNQVAARLADLRSRRPTPEWPEGASI